MSWVKLLTAPVDIAATFASLLGVNQPSASVGNVLTVGLKPAKDVTYPKEAPPASTTRPRRRRRSAATPTAAAPAAAEAHTP